MLRSKLIDDLIAAYSENSQPVNDIRVGVSWTAVHGKYFGMTKTYGIPVRKGNYTRNMGNLTGMETAELAEYAHSWDMIEASIGCAAIMSMVPPSEDSKDFNAKELIMKRSAEANVVMVGAFPFMDRIRTIASELYVLELDESQINPALGILPSSASEYVISESDLLVISGSTLVNKSLERLLALARQSKTYTIILGPSTVMSEVLFDYGADMLAGSQILKPEAIMKRLSQTGGVLDSKNCPGEIAFRVMEK